MASYQVLGHGQGEGGRLHHSIDEEGRVVVESQNDRLFHPAAAPAAARAGHVDRPGAQPHRPPDGDVDDVGDVIDRVSRRQETEAAGHHPPERSHHYKTEQKKRTK